MRLFHLLICGVFVFVNANVAIGIQFTYSSQTGQLEGSGGTPALGSTSLTQPLSGLGDLDESFFVSDSSGSDAYSGGGTLTTSLGMSSLSIDLSSTSSVQGCDPFSEIGCFATGSVSVIIAFTLDTSALTQIEIAQHPSTNNGSSTTLTHQTLGFSLSISPDGDLSIDSCGSLATSECFGLADLFFGGAVLPSGQYEVTSSLFSFVPTGPCAVGCNATGGSYVINIISVPPSVPALGGVGHALLATLLIAGAALANGLRTRRMN